MLSCALVLTLLICEALGVAAEGNGIVEVKGALPYVPQGGEPLLLREGTMPAIVDVIPQLGDISFLGCEGKTLMVLYTRYEGWEEDKSLPTVWCPSGVAYLVAFDTETGRILWRRNCGWRSSRVLRVEKDSFWHLQQSCQVSLFAVKRALGTGRPVFAVSLSAVPPIDEADDLQQGQALASYLAGSFTPCPFQRHLHWRRSFSEKEEKAPPKGKTAPKQEPPLKEFGPTLVLRSAEYGDRTLWIYLSWSRWEKEREYVCAADLGRGIWAWYEVKENCLLQGFRLSEEEKEAAKTQVAWAMRPDPLATVPAWHILPAGARLLEGGKRYRVAEKFTLPEEQEEEDSSPHTITYEVTPVRGLYLECKKARTVKVSPPAALKAAPGDRIVSSLFTWSPYVLCLWRKLCEDLKAAGVLKLLTREGKAISEFGPFRLGDFGSHLCFACEGERAALLAADAVFSIERKRTPEGTFHLEVRATTVKPRNLPPKAHLLTCDVALRGDRLFCGFLIEEPEDFSPVGMLILCRSFGSGKILWRKVLN